MDIDTHNYRSLVLTHTRAYLNCWARVRWIAWHTCSTVTPFLNIKPSSKSGDCPGFFVYTLIKHKYSHSISSRKSRFNFILQLQKIIMKNKTHKDLWLWKFKCFWVFYILPNYNAIGLSSNSIDFLYWYLIYFVIYIKARQVYSICIDDIDQFVRAIVLAKQHLSIKDFIFM